MTTRQLIDHLSDTSKPVNQKVINEAIKHLGHYEAACKVAIDAMAKKSD